MKQIITLCLLAFLGTTILNAQAPVITSFAPLKGKPGDAVTLTGTGFNTTAANNIVFCGATKATVTAATTTSVTITVPTGATYDIITLLNTGTGLAAYSRTKFTPTFSPAKTGITTSDFSTKMDFALSSSAQSAAIGDMDGDGKADIVVATGSGVTVFRNTTTPGIISTSSFAAGVNFAVAGTPTLAIIVDMDRDGKLDMVVGFSTGISIFRNTSTIGSISTSSFATKIDLSTANLNAGNGPSFAVSDLNGDGKPDIVGVGSFGSLGNATIFPNTSSPGNLVVGDFISSQFTTDGDNLSLNLSDFNGDGKPDITQGSQISPSFVRIYRNISTIGGISNFAPKTSVLANKQTAEKITSADFDGDGKLDLITIGVGSFSISRNTSTVSFLSFSTKVDFTSVAGTNFPSFAVADLDGDGKPDIATAIVSTGVPAVDNSVSVFRNQITSGITTTSFASSINFPTGIGPISIAIGDLDGDGRPDLVTANSNNTISVLRNTGAIPCTNNTGTFTTASCGSYTWAAKGNKVYTASNNTDTIHLTNAGGCDSLVTLNLTVKTASTSTTNTSICPSQLPYSWNGSRATAGTYTFTTTNSQGCDSVATLNLTVKTNTSSTTNVSICPSALPYSWNGSRASAGTYTYTTTNSQGCDSVATLNLTVKTNTTSTTNTSICPSALPYSWNGSRATGGTYTFTTTNSQGCDSVATLNLTVKTNTASTTNVSICPSALPYSWNGSRASAGTYTFTTTNSQGCDSVATLNLTVKTNTASTTNVSICPSALPYSWNGSRTAAGTYTFTTTNSQGCDSVATLNLIVKTNTTLTTNTSICSSQLPYSWNGSRAAAGTYTYTTTNSVGCDSIATLNLSVKTNYTITASAGSNGSINNAGATTVCEGNNQLYTIAASSGYHIADVLVDGTSQGALTTYTFSNVTANHTIAASFAANCVASSSSTTQTACVSYSWNGTTYTTSGDYTAHFTNSCGLDSAATLHLTINAATSSTQTASVCSNQLPYTWNGLTFTAAGTQTKTGLTNSKGCDSSATLILSVATSSPSSISINSTATTICAGTLVIFTATPVNGGIVPIYQWKKNGVNVGSNSNVYTSTSLNNNDSVWCVLTSNSACATNASSNSNKVKVTVNANPVITSITNGSANIATTSLCTLGSTYKYFNATSYGVWSSDNVSVASVTGGSQAGVVTANTNGTATIKYTVSNTAGCTSSASLLVTVAQQATPNAITGVSSACAGTTIALSNTTPSGVWSSLSNNGTINNSGVYAAANAGGGQVRYTVTNTAGCSAYASKTITVNAKPGVPTITYSSTSAANRSLFTYGGNFCVGKSCTVVGIPSGGSWAYTNPLAGTITNGGLVSFIGVGSGAIVYTYTDANGCSNSRTMSGNVAVCPIPKGVTINNEQLAIDGDFTMYPNPAKTFISINVNTLIGEGSIVVTDLYSKAVKTQALSLGTNAVDIANLSKGFYLVSVIKNEGKTTKKLIVE